MRMFFNTPLVRRTNDGAHERLSGKAGLPIEIIPRSRCSFARERTTGSAAKARRAIKLRAQQIASTDDLRTRIVFDPNEPSQAGVWSWVQENNDSNQRVFFKPAAVPETLAYESLMDGVRLLRCLEGFEGQIWSDGALKASRWWHQEPREDEWVYFLRSGKAEVTSENIAASSPVDPIWRKFKAPFDSDPENLRQTFSPFMVSVVIAALFASIVAFHGVRAAWYTMDTAAMKSAYQKHVSDNRPAMAERRRALAARKDSQTLSVSWPQARAADVVQEFLKEMPPEVAKISTISLSQGEFLARGVQLSDVDHADLVTRLEKSQLLTDVNIEIEPNNTGFVINARTADLLSSAF